MKRDELLKAAKLLGIPAKGKNEELKAKIDAKLAEVNGTEEEVEVITKPVAEAIGTNNEVWVQPKQSKRGVHPITGKPV